MNKKILLAGAFCALATQGAYAGGVVEPTMEQEVVVAETAASSGGSSVALAATCANRSCCFWN